MEEVNETNPSLIDGSHSSSSGSNSIVRIEQEYLDGLSGWSVEEYIQRLDRHPEQATKACDDDGYRLLHWAALEGRLDVVRLLINRYGESARAGNAVLPSFETALHWAAMNGRVSVAVELCAHGASDSDPDWAGVTPLHVAAQHNRPLFVQWLLARGAPIAPTTALGYTPLHMACQAGAFDAAWALVQSGAPLDCVEGTGKTPLHLAAGSRAASHALVRLLLSSGAKALVFDEDGDSAAMLLPKDSQARLMLEAASVHGSWRFAPARAVNTTGRRILSAIIPFAATVGLLLAAATLKWYVTVLLGLACVYAFQQLSPLWRIAPQFSPLAPFGFFVGAWAFLAGAYLLGGLERNTVPQVLDLFVVTCLAAVPALTLAIRTRGPGVLPKGQVLRDAEILELECAKRSSVGGGGGYCPGCVAQKPPNYRHCTVCNRCVLRFDHHCPYVASCIGARNVALFLALLLVISLLLAALFTAASVSILQNLPNSAPLVPAPTPKGNYPPSGSRGGLLSDEDLYSDENSPSTSISSSESSSSWMDTLRFLDRCVDRHAFPIVVAIFSIVWLVYVLGLLRDMGGGYIRGLTTYDRALLNRRQ